jgi:D-arginine utilization repressor
VVAVAARGGRPACTAFDQAAGVLAEFAAPASGQPPELFDRDWEENVNGIVGSYVRDAGTPPGRLSRAGRLMLLARLEAAGIFTRRRSVPAVARALGISRSMTCKLLAEAREAGVGEEHTAGAHAS